MKQSTDRILITHTGSLPRPQEVVDFLIAQDRGDPIDAARFDAALQRAVADAVSRQAEAGVDIVSDGEMSKISYATYIRHRLTGFEPGDVPRATPADLDDFPEYRDRIAQMGATPKYLRPICKGPISVKDPRPLQQDIARFKRALSPATVGEAFMTAVSPGTIAMFQPNEYYPSHQAYLEALADAMRAEYETIVGSGLLLQVDCPDLAFGRHVKFRDAGEDEFLLPLHQARCLAETGTSMKQGDARRRGHSESVDQARPSDPARLSLRDRDLGREEKRLGRRMAGGGSGSLIRFHASSSP